MRITDFDVYQNLIKEKSGLTIQPDQSFLLDSRLAPVAKKWGYSSVEAMTAVLHGVPDRDLVYDVIEAMIDRETSFFRDYWPFRSLENDVLPWFAKNRNGKKLKIWCAASSTGQEPYSVCLSIREKATALSGWKIEILATDISHESLEQSKAGIYSQAEVQRGVPVRTMLKHFKELGDGNWQINADIRKMVKHQHFNLMDNMAALGKFDIILCRNVLSQFDGATQAKVLDRLAGQLEKDGFLFLGKKDLAQDMAENGHFNAFQPGRGLYSSAAGPHAAKTVAEMPQALAKNAV